MTGKQGIRALLFLAILIGALWVIDANLRFAPEVQSVLIDQRFKEMYTDTENTWDGVILGSSNADRAWAAPLAYKEYGMALYPMTVDGGPFVLIPNVLGEVLKRQELSFAVVELHGLSTDNITPDPSRIRYVTDRMKRSANWLDAVNTGMDYLEAYGAENIPGGDADTLRLSYYFPLIQFHVRTTADELTMADFVTGNTEMKGVFDAKWSYISRQEEPEPDEHYPEATQQQKMLIDRLLAYGSEKGIRLLFFNVATDLSDESTESINAAVAYLREKGCSVLNMNEADALEKCGLDGDSDFYDKNHLNALGARKFTLFLSKWIREQVQVPDHRGDERYQSWEDAADYYDSWYQETLKKAEEWKAENRGQ